jgi:hypothetical protein
MRWDVPYHLLDAFFYASTEKMSVPFLESKAAKTVLEKIKKYGHPRRARLLRATSPAPSLTVSCSVQSD